MEQKNFNRLPKSLVDVACVLADSELFICDIYVTGDYIRLSNFNLDCLFTPQVNFLNKLCGSTFFWFVSFSISAVYIHKKNI